MRSLHPGLQRQVRVQLQHRSQDLCDNAHSSECEISARLCAVDSQLKEALAPRVYRRYAIPMQSTEERVAGSLLQSARVRLGLSQTAFADLLGIAQPTLSAYESGHRQPTLPTLMRMLERAGLELRLELAERDNHDAVLAEWERTLDDATKQRLRSQGYRLASDAA